MSAPINRFQIRKILLVGSPYCGFLLEESGMRPIGSTTQGDAPEFELVRSTEAAQRALDEQSFQLVIIYENPGDVQGSALAKTLRAQFPQVDIVVVSGDTAMGGPSESHPLRDINFFVHYGAPSFWRALVRFHEDEHNASRLLSTGSMAILLVEDEPNFYSHFLPALYDRIRTSAVELLPEYRRPSSLWEVSKNRPLVLLRRSFEEACEALIRYQKTLMALITDLRIPVDGALSGDAGLRLLYRARALQTHLPVVVTSREAEQRDAVGNAHAKFLWKDSPRLLSELDGFLRHYCGFGPFIFRWPNNTSYGTATNLTELRQLCADVPDVVFDYHALHEDFSTWLGVHGYRRLARATRAMHIVDLNVREKLLEAIDEELLRQENDPYSLDD